MPTPPQSPERGKRPLIARLVEPPPLRTPLSITPEQAVRKPKRPARKSPFLPEKEVGPSKPPSPPEQKKQKKKTLPGARQQAPPAKPSLKVPPPSVQELTKEGEAGGPLSEKEKGRDTGDREIKRRLPTRRELLAPGLIDRLARRFERKERKRKGNRDKGITFDADELRYRSYLMKLKSRIEHIWVYPRELAQRGIFGDLYIQFTIRKDGSLGSVKLLRTSGYSELDEAAMRALREGAPYWPLPEKWEEEAITITGHFIYTLSGFYIR